MFKDPEQRRAGVNDEGSSYTCPWSSRPPRGSASHQVRVRDDAQVQSPRIHDAGKGPR